MVVSIIIITCTILYH